MPGKQNAISIFNAAVEAVHPSRLMDDYLQLVNNKLIIKDQQLELRPDQRIFVIGAGKAVAAMAIEAERILGERIYKGLVTTKYHHTLPLHKIRCIEAAHPIPDHTSFTALAETLTLLKEVKADDIILCLLSGGASSLWADLPDGITLEDLLRLYDILLKSGMTIEENNTIRKHVSKTKGGQLLQYAPKALWFSLIISDVINDDLSVIASGFTSADNSSFSDAIFLLDKYRITEKIPAQILVYLQQGAAGLYSETIKENDPLLSNVNNYIIGSNSIALTAAGNKAMALGYHLHSTQLLSGDAATTGSSLIRLCKKYDSKLPACLLAGGETTVIVKGDGKGGRNQHMALSALMEMKERNDSETFSFCFLSAGTDGTDGATDAAGAIADIESIAVSVQKKLDPAIFLNKFDAYTFFKQTGGLLKSGATQTNVMDIVIILIE